MPPRAKTLGFIGAGNMAEAIARSAIDQGVLTPGEIIAADVSPERQVVFAEIGIDVTDDAQQVLAACEQVMLAVKPQHAETICETLSGQVGEDQIIISIMAGIGSAKLAAMLSGGDDSATVRVIRAMPNTPLIVGLGMTGVARGDQAFAGDEALSMKLFGSGMSEAVFVDEDRIDAITAVSGSGPAYLFYLAEAMEQAASAMGLGEDGERLVTQTLLGAATLLLQSPDPAAELRRKVSSPGGTTEAAINHMESQSVREAIADAVRKAEARSKELGH